MKTPEEMAKEYLDQDKVACDAINHDAEDLVKAAFLAGYKATQQWISVKDRLPEFCKTIVAYGPRIYCVISQLMQDEEGYSYVGPYMSVHPDEVTHWCEVPELPAPPKEAK